MKTDRHGTFETAGGTVASGADRRGKRAGAGTDARSVTTAVGEPLVDRGASE
jgi:hypothetical protein